MTIDPAKLANAVSDDAMHAKAMRDPKVRAAFDALAPRYELINAVIAARLDQGWTQADLGRAAGSSQSAIARLESGLHDPKWSTAVRICRALDIPLSIGDGPRMAV